MILRIESTTGEFITELDLKDMDVTRLLEYAMTHSENHEEYNLPLTDEDVTKLLEFAVVSILNEEIKKIESTK